MPRPSQQMDVFSLVIDRLADALAERLNGSVRNGASGSHRSSGTRRKGEKRAPALLSKTTTDLLAHIKGNPGQRIEQIATAMGFSTTELKLPTQKLLANRQVKTKGERRGTKYFAS